MGIVEETQEMENRTFLPTTTIKGSKVVNVKEEHLGVIEELMIDSKKGKIAYVLLSFGGFLGIGTKLFAIPWESLEYNRSDYILRIDKSVLEKLSHRLYKSGDYRPHGFDSKHSRGSFL